MPTLFIPIAIITLLGAMSPGPDFACVTKNTILHSRRAGIFTSLGLSLAIVVHMTYCILGLALIISQSLYLFTTIKYIGACYLIYLGINLLLTKSITKLNLSSNNVHKKQMRDSIALRQGFLCNLLNPKAMMFFLAIFTLIIKPTTPDLYKIIYATEIVVITFLWFAILSIILSHKNISRLLNRAEFYIIKFLGIFLIVFGIILAFVKN